MSPSSPVRPPEIDSPGYRGMTLVEVLVALFIVALALGAAISVVDEGITHVAYMKQRTLAHWVAMNKATELQLPGGEAALGERSGTELMGGEEWHWVLRVMQTPDPNLRRAEIEVRSAPDETQPLATLTAYVGHLR